MTRSGISSGNARGHKESSNFHAIWPHTAAILPFTLASLNEEHWSYEDFFSCFCTDISSEHSLRTCTQVRRGVRMQKKKKKRTRSDRVWHSSFDFTERSLHRAGATHVVTVVLAKGIISQVCRCFCKRNAFLRVGKAHNCFE